MSAGTNYDAAWWRRFLAPLQSATILSAEAVEMGEKTWIMLRIVPCETNDVLDVMVTSADVAEPGYLTLPRPELEPKEGE